ncbi:uncharacterized protein LOC114580241 [Dendrobium catenatum]|uniref:uncharacterized protein LOC114580241 n=1 Tax=Dendrobium catenatum TaxID=906689 RepID=UPI0010A00338|nr:uncharacterized protein LOC114580241 [Dendrobium catenatum]
MVRNKNKAASGHTKDPAWKHSTQVDVGGSDKTYVYLKCNYCDKVVKGGVTRMKEHLSGSQKNVAPCSKVPDAKQFEDRVDVGSYYGSERSVRDSFSSMKLISSRSARGPIDHYMVDTSEDRPSTTQKMAPENAREARRRMCKDIGRFFYENAITFNVATSPSYYNMFRSVGAFERGFKSPTMYDLRTWILKELKNTDKSIEKIKKTWAQTGVTIISDGWSDIKYRSLINILINNPYDSIIDEVGEHLVVQIVIDNASSYKAAALMRKFSKKEILRPAATKFATAYLTLESMLDDRQPLEAMFTSIQWLSCAWAKKAEGKEIRKIVLNDRFWQIVLYAITTTRPLVHVLRMVDAEKEPAMGFIYNAMDEAKEMIASNLGGSEGSFKKI